MKPAELKKLLKVRAKLEVIEGKLGKKLNRELLSLPQKYGFGGMDELISTLQELNGGGGGGGKAAGKGGKRKKRAKVTPEMEKELQAMVKAGKTGNEIAAALKVSLPTVQKIKKKVGLVKER